MKKKSVIKFFFISILLASFSALGETLNTSSSATEYTKPKFFDFITDIPRSLDEGGKYSFNTKPKTLWLCGGVISSSVLFYIYDEKLYKHARIFARSIGLGNDDHTKPMLTLGKFNIFRGPTDVGSTIFFIGDGWLQAITAGSFLVNGSMTNDNRAMQTGSQIMNSLVTASIPTQILKRATGREDPNRASKYRGRWRPFSKNYSKDQSAYDAVPSGHIMAATSTLTVIDANYPEYRSFMRPLSFTLISLVGFQMLNVGVHWASDYPLGIAMGYVFGTVASTHGKKTSGDVSSSNWQLLPIYSSGRDQQTFGALTIIDF
ncbi:MAG: phosphatase PAP2 family protein [Bacteriovorax sp.]|nr:phosphatase PAP2 family protein [Bacteriovorax sp.]